MPNAEKLEEWKDLKGYEEYYQISNFGRVKSLDRYVKNRNGFSLRKGRFLKLSLDEDGYQKVAPCIDKVAKHITVHRLVANHFIPNPLNLPQINHKDGNKLNNRVDNLEWITAQDNHIHAAKTGLKAKGESHGMVKLNLKQIEHIRTEYKGRGKGPTLEKLSKKYKISIGHVSAIVNNKHWKNEI